jgi:hypothetical protein
MGRNQSSEGCDECQHSETVGQIIGGVERLVGFCLRPNDRGVWGKQCARFRPKVLKQRKGKKWNNQ